MIFDMTPLTGIEGAYIFRMPRNLDMQVAAVLSQAWETLVPKGAREIVFDASGTDCIDPPGVGFLVFAWDFLKNSGMTMKIVNLRKEMADQLRASMLPGAIRLELL